MRSDEVFLAGRYVENRFLLCHWVRVASRRFHKTGDPIQQTISKVLGLVTLQNSGAPEESHPSASDAKILRHPAKNSSASIVGLSQEPIRNVG